MSKAANAIQALLVTHDEVMTLDLRQRLAFGLFVCNPVIRLYSRYFQKKFKQAKACDLALETVKGRSQSKKDFERLGAAILELTPIAEEEGYSYDQVGMGAHVVLEYAEADGHNCTSAIDCAATSFALHCLHLQNVSMPSNLIGLDYLDTISLPIYSFSRTLFEQVARTSAKDLISLADTLSFEPTFAPISTKLLARIKTRPPSEETQRSN